MAIYSDTKTAHKTGTVANVGRVSSPFHRSLNAAIVGAGRRLGPAHGDMGDPAFFVEPQEKVREGRILVLLQSGNTPETLWANATAPGLQPARLKLPAIP